MARKVVPGATPKPRQDQAAAAGLPNWAWLAAGLFIGLFVALLVYLQLRPQAQAPVVAEPPGAAQPPRDEAEDGGQGPRYEFYSILPEREVLVPESAPAAGETAKDGGQQAEPRLYILQAGSFRRYADADRRRAELALLGIESTIQVVKAAQGETWHRVRIGPYQSLRELDAVRRVLNDNDIDTLLVRIKG